jgi:hypothetical protein
MFWFIRKKFVGSYFAFKAAKRFIFLFAAVFPPVKGGAAKSGVANDRRVAGGGGHPLRLPPPPWAIMELARLAAYLSRQHAL